MAGFLGRLIDGGAVFRGLDDVVARAEFVARAAHAGLTDKVGKDYADGHLADVYSRAVAYGAGPDEQAAAWLHDVVEDTEVTEQDLLDLGFTDTTVLIVHLMTKREGEPKEVYFARLRAFESARRLKLDADVASNSDPTRLALLDEATAARLTQKYAAARELLQP